MGNNVITNGLNAAITLIIMLIILGIIIKLIFFVIKTLIFKAIWNAEHKEKKRERGYYSSQNDDWLVRAQNRQNKRYEYTDPVRSKKRKEEPSNYDTGWYFDEKTGLWTPPKKMRKK